MLGKKRWKNVCTGGEILLPDSKESSLCELQLVWATSGIKCYYFIFTT